MTAHLACILVNPLCNTCIVDWKTSGSRWPVGKADYEQQATTCCYAYREKFGKNPLFRYDVATKAKLPQFGSWYTVRTEAELTRFAQLCREVERGVHAEAFYRNESQLNCGECPYRNCCHVMERRLFGQYITFEPLRQIF